MSRQSVDNLSFISAATRYNTERRPLLRGYFDKALQTGELFDGKVSDIAISDYGENNGLDPDEPEQSFRELLLMYPDDPDLQHYQMYLSIRYADLSEQIRNELGYSAVDLVSFEAFIYNQIADRAENLDIKSNFYEFEDKEEYTEMNEFEDPSKQFQNRWRACIEFSRSELIDSFLAKTDNQQLAQSLSLTERIDAANAMIDFLSKPYGPEVEYSQHQFLKTPLFEVVGEENRILVPFPSLLVSTTQIRIEEIFQNHKSLRDLEDNQKGDLVEELALEALAEFNSRNLVHSFKYTDPHPHETDGLLFFENSYWAVEVKSHPIFRKVPGNASIALNRFEEKFKDAISQGDNTLKFLKDQGEDVLYHLAGDKSPLEKEYGVIVVLDGLLPTLFSQNQHIDQTFGMNGIYEAVEEGDRVLLITLFDLFELAHQTDELGRLEDFLIWRTDFGFDMPVSAFNEREYWAMFFDNYDSDKDFQEIIDDAAKKKSLITYISNRFNDKPYLPDDGL
ncbi:hypothetical protein [Natronorubrum sp. DTA7]|uniref:hypothetical protein n=1 Tax=Natronorubrum sp. DTA7 TaxID=3447016 RepID=UPI003F86C200